MKNSCFLLDLSSLKSSIFFTFTQSDSIRFFENLDNLKVLLFMKWIHYLIKMNSHYWNSKTFDSKLIMKLIRVESLVSHFQNTYCTLFAAHIHDTCRHRMWTFGVCVWYACNDGVLYALHPIEHVPTISAVYFDRVYKTYTACISFSLAINFGSQLAWCILFGTQHLCAVCIVMFQHRIAITNSQSSLTGHEKCYA